MKKSRLVKGGLEATRKASKQVDMLQSTKLVSGHAKGFCYVGDVEEQWTSLVEQTDVSSNLCRAELQHV